MKIRNILLALSLSACAFAAQSQVKVERKYVQNEADEYRLKMKLDTVMGEVNLSMTMKEIVKKVYENGDADIETTVSESVVNVAGQEHKMPPQAPTTVRMTKNGAPVDTKSRGGMSFMQFGSFLGDKELKVGEAYSFDTPDKNNPKNHAAGVIKLLSLEGGIAKMQVTVDQYTDGVPKPLHIEGISLVDVQKGKLKKFEGTATNIPNQGNQGPMASSAQFTLEHK